MRSNEGQPSSSGEGAGAYFEEARMEEDGFEVVVAVEGSVLDLGDGTVGGDVGDVSGDEFVILGR